MIWTLSATFEAFVSRIDLGDRPRATPAGTYRFKVSGQQQKGGKQVRAWAAQGDLDADAVSSNTFTMEWPPRSGRTAEFPEIDRAGWFGMGAAREKMVAAQAEFLDRLLERVSWR